MGPAKLYRVTPRTAIFSAVLIILLILAGGIYAHYRPHSPSDIVTVGKEIAAPKTASAVGSKDKASGGITAPNARNAGGATDTHGTASASTDSSQWISSASGNITVKQPIANAKLQNGDTLSGSAKVAEVSYRLSDNTVGVIAQGSLTVSGGNFSGTLHFQPKGTGGRLDVFSTDSRGVEYNEIQINVSF